MADILAASEIDRDTWHSAAIHCHSSFRRVCLLSVAEGQLLVVTQIMEGDTLTGRLTMGENRALKIEFAPHPMLQHKLRLLLHAL
jgi:hypothetical protein